MLYGKDVIDLISQMAGKLLAIVKGRQWKLVVAVRDLHWDLETVGVGETNEDEFYRLNTNTGGYLRSLSMFYRCQEKSKREEFR